MIERYEIILKRRYLRDCPVIKKKLEVLIDGINETIRKKEHEVYEGRNEIA